MFEFFLLTMCPDNVLESWLHSFVFTSLGTLLFQTRLVLYLHQLEYGTGLQEPWSGLPHSLASVRGDKAKTGFQFMLKGCLCHILVVHLQHRSLYLILELMVIRKAGKYLVTDLWVQWTLMMKGACEGGIPDVLQCTISVTTSSVVHIDTLLSHWIDEMNNVQ